MAALGWLLNLGFAASGVQILGVPTPAGRTFTVVLEDRTYLPAIDRTYIPEEL